MNQTPYYSGVFSPMSNPRQFTDEVEDFLNSLDYDNLAMEEWDFPEEEAGQMEATEWNEGQPPEEAAQVDAIEQREDDPFEYDLNQIDMSLLEEQEMNVEQEIQVIEAQLEDDLSMDVDPVELAMSCFKRKPEEEQMSVGQEHQATESQVEEQNSQTSFINEPWIQVSQDDYNQAPTYYQYPPNPQSPVQSYRSESLEPRMAQQQMDEHEFSRACFDLYLTSNYSNKFSVYQDARKLLARYKWMFDVLPKEKREFLEEEIFQNFYVANPSTKPPKRPSRNPFYSLLKKFDVDTFGQLFEKMKTKIDEPRMRQILWDFYDYYHVKQNPYH